MPSISKETGHISSKGFGPKDIFKKISWDILRTCSGHVLCPQMCPQIFERTGQANVNYVMKLRTK